VHRGASGTAAYHLQLTAAAVARPVHSNVMPSSSVLLRGRGYCSPRRRLPGGAASGHPASGVAAVVDTARTPLGRRSPVSGRRYPPSRLVVRDPAVQPAVSGRPVSGTRVRRPGSGCPAGCRPPVRCPSRLLSPLWCPAVRCPAVRCPAIRCPAIRCPAICCSPRSVRSRPSPPTSGGGAGPGRGGRATRRPSNGRGPGGRPHRRAAGSPGRGAHGGGRRRLGSRGGQSGGRWRTRTGLGAGGGSRACLLRDQAGQPGARSARG
jgi:hypothetical protein